MPYKVKTRSKWHWKLLLPLLILVVALGGLLLYLHYHKSSSSLSTTTSSTKGTVARSNNAINYSPAQPSDNTTNEDRKSTAPATSTLNQNGTSTSSSAIGITITNASVATVSGNKVVHVGNIVSGATSGTCTLIATKSGQPNVTDTANVQLDGNTYDCGVFNTPVSNFPASGTWNLSLVVSGGDKSASANTTITI